MRLTDPDGAVARVSRRQHGAWSRAQAVEAGMSAKMIQGRVQRGHWLVLDQAVYGHAAAPPTWERSVMAAVLAEPWAVASHTTAASLHELIGFRRGRPEITVRPGANARGRLATVHRGVDVPVTTTRGIPCVRIDQTFIDLAQVAGERRILEALAARVDAEPDLLDAVRDRYCALAPSGGRNLRALKAVLERFGAGQPPGPSELERHLERLLVDPRIPAPRFEAPFPGRQPGRQRVDALIDAWRLIVEADGRTWHTRIQDFDHDRRRDAEAAAAGYLTLRFSWHQLTAERAWALRVLLDTGASRALPPAA